MLWGRRFASLPIVLFRCPPGFRPGGLRRINNLPVSWGRSPTCPGIFSHLLSLGEVLDALCDKL